jgi:endonuclease YncB( thermonuclease family)
MGLAHAVAIVPERRARADRVYLVPPGANRFRPVDTLNERAVARGLARVDELRGSYRKEMLHAQATAQRLHLGMWSRCRQR